MGSGSARAMGKGTATACGYAVTICARSGSMEYTRAPAAGGPRRVVVADVAVVGEGDGLELGEGGGLGLGGGDGFGLGEGVGQGLGGGDGLVDVVELAELNAVLARVVPDGG